MKIENFAKSVQRMTSELYFGLGDSFVYLVNDGKKYPVELVEENGSTLILLPEEGGSSMNPDPVDAHTFCAWFKKSLVQKRGWTDIEFEIGGQTFKHVAEIAIPNDGNIEIHVEK